MANAFEGLAAEDFADIHSAVAEAMAYVALPVTFLEALPATSEVDPMYGEAATEADDANWTVYGEPISASVKLSPTEEELTRHGLLSGAALLGFIPQQYILDWESNTGKTWAPTASMLVEYQGVRYNIRQIPRTDWLPVGDGSAQDTIGRVFTAITKPSKLGA